MIVEVHLSCICANMCESYAVATSTDAAIKSGSVDCTQGRRSSTMCAGRVKGQFSRIVMLELMLLPVLGPMLSAVAPSQYLLMVVGT